MSDDLTEDEQKVIETLNNPKWDYRTIKGIVKDSGLSESVVASIIESRNDLVRESVVPSKSGERIYTLVKKVSSLRDLWSAFRMINMEKF